MTTREANLVKTRRRCLKCGKAMLTDRCHRICAKCAHTNEGLLEERAAVTPDLRHWLRTLVRTGRAWDLGSLVHTAPAAPDD